MEKGKLFSGNTLKIIGCIFMLIDHIGLFLLPNVAILRYIGRIAYPIFAFMLAEGCTFTKNRLKHFLLIFGMAIIIQVVYFLAIKDYSFSIFLVFSISIILIYLYDYIINNTINIKESTNKTKNIILLVLCVLLFLSIISATIVFDIMTPYLKASYGYHGVLIPLIVYAVMKASNRSLLVTLIVLLILLVVSAIMREEYYNFYSIIAIPLLFLYNGKRGKYNIKYFFYLFYPLHLVIIYLIYLLIYN